MDCQNISILLCACPVSEVHNALLASLEVCFQVQHSCCRTSVWACMHQEVLTSAVLVSAGGLASARRSGPGGCPGASRSAPGLLQPWQISDRLLQSRPLRVPATVCLQRRATPACIARHSLNLVFIELRCPQQLALCRLTYCGDFCTGLSAAKAKARGCNKRMG